MEHRITTDQALMLFEAHGGVLTTSEAHHLGIHSKTLYKMCDHQQIDSLGRGIFRLADYPLDATHIDLITTLKHLPKGVICLISALNFHGLTTQIPRQIYVAYQQGWWEPTKKYPPVKIIRYSQSSFAAGIEYHTLNGVQVPIYSAAKTVVDCFKFRNRVGLDVAIEALKDFWRISNGTQMQELLLYAKICRVTNIMTPYLEAIIHE